MSTVEQKAAHAAYMRKRYAAMTTLGKVEDDVELLDKMIVYLMRSRRPRLVHNA